jgi:hypothetical protein
MITKVLLYGEIVEYHACSSSTYNEAVNFYKKSFDYIGKSKTFYVGGRKYNSEKNMYFFRYKDNTLNQKIVRRFKLRRIKEE